MDTGLYVGESYKYKYVAVPRFPSSIKVSGASYLIGSPQNISSTEDHDFLLTFCTRSTRFLLVISRICLIVISSGSYSYERAEPKMNHATFTQKLKYGLSADVHTYK